MRPAPWRPSPSRQAALGQPGSPPDRGFAGTGWGSQRVARPSRTQLPREPGDTGPSFTVCGGARTTDSRREVRFSAPAGELSLRSREGQSIRTSIPGSRRRRRAPRWTTRRSRTDDWTPEAARLPAREPREGHCWIGTQWSPARGMWAVAVAARRAGHHHRQCEVLAAVPPPGSVMTREVQVAGDLSAGAGRCSHVPYRSGAALRGPSVQLVSELR